MNDSMYIAATGMHMQQKNVDTIANNLANVNTPGFKKGKVSFEDLVYRGLGQAQGVPGLGAGSGVGIRNIAKVFSQGDLKRTDRPLDMAIQGDGFLEISLADGSHAYSRGGTLMVDAQGFLATSEGEVLKPAIQVGPDARSITIAADGRVTVQSGDRGMAEVGRIELVRFSDTSGLVPQGANLYRPSEQSGDAIYGRPGEEGVGTLAQGFIEASNVQLVEEMVELMVAQRAYESSVKVIQAADEMLSMSNNLRK